ncbi:MAG: dTDP-glucose 4,6-dehydratase [Chloroflexota bacterium]|nr:dTDP-glucose 4,6-dehydratase [Chloroflexota bacterium]
MNLLIPGGAGFIGSNFVRYALDRWPNCRVTVLDKLTYAGNLANLAEVEDDPRFRFVRGDICDPEMVRAAMAGCSQVVNFAAETHVDRSILSARDFIRTDVEGTQVLLEAARAFGVERYLQVSTDEVYGHVDHPHRTDEEAHLAPRSPYSASKAAGDLMVGAYHTTFGVPTLITRGSNTYGPYQYPEKLIPLFVTNAIRGLPLPIYGDGRQMRDWLYVEDHCAGIATVLERGTPGQIYNIGQGSERPNLEIIQEIIRLTGCDPALTRHVVDRPGHDRRYALDTSKTRALGWSPSWTLDTSLEPTVRWYQNHRAWWESLQDEAFRAYYRQQYEERLAAR